MNREEYYTCQIKVPRWGKEGQDILSNTKCLVVGMGGLGCPVSMYLAGSGIGRLGICDYDVIEPSNISRQVLYTTAETGKDKVTIAGQKLREQNPLMDVVLHNEQIDETTWKAILSDYDLILDCTDNFHSKYLIHDACLLLGKNLIQAGIFQMSGQVYFFPFAHRTKKENLDNAACLRCVWEEIPSGSHQSCAEGGVLTAVAGTTALRQVNTALLSLLKKNKTSSDMSLFDWEALEWTVVGIPPRETCACRSADALKNLTAYLHEPSLEIESLTAQALEKYSAWPPVIIDVRNPADQIKNEKFQPFVKKGLSLQGLEKKELDDLSHFMKENGKEKAYVLVCYRGIRSRSLTRTLRENGYTAFSYAGGYGNL